MELAVGTLVNLLILSSMYILAALGFAFLFNMLRVLNFAHGAIYMLGAYICYYFISLTGMNHWLALALATLIVAGIGVFLERCGFRPFIGDFNRTLMVSIAVIVFSETTVNILAGQRQLALPPFVTGTVQVGSVAVSKERIVTAAIGILLLALMMWFVNRTKWGRQMQAVAEHREGAALQGINIPRLSALAFSLGCALAAIAGCLMGAYLRLSPFMGDTILVKILIVVMLAGAGSINGIVTTGLIVGTLSAVLPVFLTGAASDAIFIVVVILLVLVRPQGFFGYEVELEMQGEAGTFQGAQPFLRGGRRRQAALVGGAILVVVALMPLFVKSAYYLHILTLTFIYVVAAVSLRTITISGQFPLAHGGFMGVGAYLSGMAAKWLHWPPLVSMVAAAVGAMALGMIVSYPFSRLRSLYYAMGSLFFGIGITYFINAGGKWTNGFSGLTGIPPLFPGSPSKVPYFYFFLALMLVCLIALYRLEACRIGTILKAIAQSDLIASSVGINEAWYRIFVVGVGCFFAGLAGAGYSHFTMVISPSAFNFMMTLWLVMYVVVGGMHSFWGPVVGTTVLFLLPELTRSLGKYSPFVSGALVLIVAYLLPRGLVSLPQVVVARFRGLRNEGPIRNAVGN